MPNFLSFLVAVEGINPVRRDKLVDLLDIDLQWRMHKVSDGQRRRVQICMGLLHPFQVISLHGRSDGCMLELGSDWTLKWVG